MSKNHKNRDVKTKKTMSIYADVHKDIAQFCLDYGYKQYQVVAEGFYLLKEKKDKEAKGE